MKKLDEKRVLVTGGTTGIGLAAARLFHDEGARVLVTGRNEKTLAEARKVLPADVGIVRSDAASLADAAVLADTVRRELGGLDAAFLNAGIGRFQLMEAVAEADWDETFATNVKGPFFLLQKLRPLFGAGAAVLLNTSVADVKGFATTSVYSASKAALRSLVRTLAAEWVGAGIRVNAVSPGPIDTPIFEKLGLPAEHLAGFQESLTSTNPMKRFGAPEEVAKAALFLLSPDSSYTTGFELAVDGGITQL